MAKKPILTDDELDGGFAPGPATPPPLPGTAGGMASGATSGTPAGATSGAMSGATSGATRMTDTPASATRIVGEPEADATPPPPPPAQQGRDASGHERPKTRIHGYGEAATPPTNEADPEAADEALSAAPVVGWLVVTAGPGRGASVTLNPGMNGVGRGPDNAAQVDFGDDTISREAHAFVVYDDETRLFHLSHGGKTNLVRLNGSPVLTSEALTHGDTMRIGATTLRFVALCGPDFDWADA